MNPDMNTGAGSSEKQPAGAMVSIIIIALVILAGAYYFLRDVSPSTQESAQAPQEVDATLAGLNQQDTSDAVSSIQKDIGNIPDLSKIGDNLAAVQI